MAVRLPAHAPDAPDAPEAAAAVEAAGLLSLREGWQCLLGPPGLARLPSELPLEGWLPAEVPGTVASALRAAGRFQYGEQDFDRLEAWFRLDRAVPAEAGDADGYRLRFDGLATLVDVYWDDRCVLQTDNMFRAYELALDGLPATGRLTLHCKSLALALGQKRPRPRWKTRLVEQQQLRWWRTTLLGRIPGWSPPVAPLGPYRTVHLLTPAALRVDVSRLQARLDGDDGRVDAELLLSLPAGPPSARMSAQMSEQMSTKTLAQMPAQTSTDALPAEPPEVLLCVGAASVALAVSQAGPGTWSAQGQLLLQQPAKWWPHTHGQATLHAAELRIRTAQGWTHYPLGRLGFRTVALDQAEGGFALRINGVPVFCRGACWTPVDLLSLTGAEQALRPTLECVRDAGMNMLRVGGTMVYEDQPFYALCDALGILVWQDFMFANLDYPAADDGFVANVRAEATGFLQRTQPHACMAVLCGNSEVEQQAAMLGLTREHWRNTLFGEVLPALCGDLRPDVVYWPSSPAGGVLPFQVDHGVSHYYGVGAYLRPLEDARRAGVRFTSECLAFAHVPEEASIDELLKRGGQAVHHPLWKQRVPRDNGAGWDFEDVRDHYLALLFGVDPMRLRYADMPRYLALSRAATGEVLAQTLGEWRRDASSCRGALIWFLRDLWLGAGWGLLDALGRPKAAYWYARRAMQALAVHLSDEGNNGLEVQLRNDHPEARTVVLELALYREGEVRVAHATRSLHLPAHGHHAVRADALFEHFLDTSYAYRFGPPGHQLAVARVFAAGPDDASTLSGDSLAEAFFQLLPMPSVPERELGLQASFAIDAASGAVEVLLSTRRFAQAICLDVPGYQAQDNHFHMAPGSQRRIALRAQQPVTRLSGTVAPLNLALPLRIAPAASPAPPTAAA